jgi:hypothetical protein
VAQKIARDADALGLEDRDRRRRAMPKKVGTDRMAKFCAGSRRDCTVNCLTVERTPFGPSPKAVVQVRTPNQWSHISEVTFQ